jgi:hypothetical protein
VIFVRPGGGGNMMPPRSMTILSAFDTNQFSSVIKTDVNPADGTVGMREPQLVDIDNDGDLDLVGIEMVSGMLQGLVWLENLATAPPSFGPPQMIGTVRPKAFAITGW